MDTQQVELMGRNLLTSYFIADGIEVSLPMRDRGIDLIAFDDMNSKGEFRAVPVQLKASSKRSFSVHKKYQKFANLLMTYVWNAADPLNAELYAMTYKQALDVASQLGWTSSASWKFGAGYSTQAPSKRVIAALAQYKYKPGCLAGLVNQSSYIKIRL